MSHALGHSLAILMGWKTHDPVLNGIKEQPIARMNPIWTAMQVGTSALLLATANPSEAYPFQALS